MRPEIERSKTEYLENIANSLRLRAWQIIDEVASGHIGACSSSAELLATLYFGGNLAIDPNNPNHPNRDRVILRGHLGPLRYSLFSKLGWITEDQLHTYRKLDGLDGHEKMDTAGVDIAPNASLGMGLSYGVGCALDAKVNNYPYRSIVFLGDGEFQEGNIVEAAQQAATMKLNNLIVVMDKNGGQLSCMTDQIDPCLQLSQYWVSMGWDVIELSDGHDIAQIQNAYDHFDEPRDRPLIIIANTKKGRGLVGADESLCGYHTLTTCPGSVLKQGITSLEEVCKPVKIDFNRIKRPIERVVSQTEEQINIVLKDETLLDTNKTFVQYLQKLNEITKQLGILFYFITADFFQNDLAEECGFDLYNRDVGKGSIFINTGLREQHMMAMAYGIAVSNPNALVVLATGDQFIYRCMDQINASAQGYATQKAPNGFGSIVIMSQFAGLTSTRNGLTHTSSGQPGAIMSMPGIEMREPINPEEFVRTMNEAINSHVLTLIRRHQAAIEGNYSIYEGNNRFYPIIGESDPDIVIVGSGFPIIHAENAVRQLNERGIHASVINIVDPHSLQDPEFLKLVCRGVPVLVIYNGNPFPLAGLVSQAILLSGKGGEISRLEVMGFDYGCTGRGPEVIKKLGLDVTSIANKIVNLVHGV